jgi:paraquat-inducible protein A
MPDSQHHPAMFPLGACHCCGRIHRLPPVPARSVAHCVRCDAVIRHAGHPRSTARTAALASAALIVYPLALTLPVMRIERLGHASDASIWSGMVGLLAEGHLFVGLIVLLFSVIAPIAKLVALFVLCAGRRGLHARHRARTYRLVEFIGRWGMVDVLLVAVVVAAVKLGDLVQVTPGPGVVAFGSVVLLSLLASTVFDPHAIWETEPA